MKWTKPNGTEIETNDRPETVEAAEALGWKRKQARTKAAKPKTDGADTE